VSDYLTVAEILAIHEDQLDRFGGAAGVRDLGLLEAALVRPQTGYYPDVIAEGAALWESLSQNHPFVDGNKRTAFAAMFTHLAINGVGLFADAETTWAFLAPLYEMGAFRFEVLDDWVRRQTKAIESDR
jgi:death-on-curing protein